jgi:hypothetical protein
MIIFWYSRFKKMGCSPHCGNIDNRSYLSSNNNKPMNMIMKQDNVAVAIYGTHTEAESVINQLKQSNFDMSKLSIVGRSDYIDKHVLGYYNNELLMKKWSKIGAFWGEVWGATLGPAFFFIPDFGRLAFAGPIVGWLTDTLKTGAVMDRSSALGAGLITMGIPEKRVLVSKDPHEADRFVIIAQGSEKEVQMAHDIIATTCPVSLSEHQMINDSERFVAEEIQWRNHH